MSMPNSTVLNVRKYSVYVVYNIQNVPLYNVKMKMYKNVNSK